MLESIRSGAQSFGVKVAFGIIILVFVFWGVGNFNDRDYSNVVAVVNGEPIVALEFEKAYHNAEEYLLRNNPGLTREQLAKDHLGRQVLNDLIRATLVAQEARRAGIEVSPLEMRLAVEKNKAFLDENGKFDPEAYTRVLASQRLSPAQYEKELSDQLLSEKMFTLVTAPIWVDPDDALNRFNFLRERRVIDYAFIPAQAFQGQVKVPENEAKDWYDSHQAEFAIPPMVDVAYLMVAPENLVERKNISEAAALAWYEANKSKFAKPERIHARHILVPIAENADDTALKAASDKIAKAAAELAKGRPFAQVADEINETGVADKGGDLGWLGRGQTIPEFEAAAFALPVGKVSEPVRSKFGLHLILIEEKQEAGIPPFVEVADSAYKALAFEEGSEKLHDVLDNLIEDNILQKPLEQVGSRYGIKPAQTGMLDKEELMRQLGIKADAAEALLAVPAGAPLDTALEAGNNYIVARIIKAEPASVKPFETVKNEIDASLAQKQALELAMRDAAAMLEKIKNETPLQAASQKLDIKTSIPLERGGNVPGFEPDETLINAIFVAKPQTWLGAPQAVKTDKGQPGAFIAYIDKLVPPEEGEFESVAQILANAGKQERMEGLYGMFIQNLADKAKVEITNQNFIDRLNM